MFNPPSLRAFLLLLLSSAASTQNMTIGGSPQGGYINQYQAVMTSVLDQNLWLINGQNRSPLESAAGSISKLDLKAPGKARHEFDKGYQLLQRKDLPGAVEHLTAATTIYSSFVAAHNALGSAYLGLNQNDQARAEFTQAISLDDHLPNSYLNLGCAELALKHYPDAEQAIQKASDIAPLDLDILTALVYGQFMNQHFDAAVATARKVHDRKHSGAAMVHFYAAAAQAAQAKPAEAQHELLTFMHEDPKSPAAAQAAQIMEQLKEEEKHPRSINPDAGLKVSYTTVPSEATTGPAPIPQRIQQLLQASKENAQIAEAEADAACPNCNTEAAASPDAAGESSPGSVSTASNPKYSGLVFRSSIDEVNVFFAATDHGKPVIDLTGNDIGIRDNRKAPAAITGFRNEAELPLRLGLLIDASASIQDRFKFEQESAASFMQKVMNGPDDLAFVIGFSNSVLLVQDFTGDSALISNAVGKLVPSGGTALWDAVALAADKLSARPERQPVARILVVISDGQDNSSTIALKEAISRAQHDDVAVYTVNTREAIDNPSVDLVSAVVGERALGTLAELTGGAAFTPGSVRRLKGNLADLQQVIRSRYMISYKPALFKRDGQYRTIDIEAEKAGHKLKIYARKGYFASAHSPAPAQF